MKTIFKIFIVLFFINTTILFGNTYKLNCNKVFNFNVNNKGQLTYLDLLEVVTNDCDYSLSIKDDVAFELLNKNIRYLKAKDYDINKIFKMIVFNNNLFYKYNPNLRLVEIGYFKVKTFNIDYISFDERKNESTYKLSTSSGGSSSGGTGVSGSTGGGSSSSGSDSRSISYNSSFKMWQNLNEELKFILRTTSDMDNMLYIDQEAGIITVKANQRQLKQIENYINKLTKRLHKQILLETKIIDVTLDDETSTGVDWSKFDLGINASFDAGSFSQTGIIPEIGVQPLGSDSFNHSEIRLNGNFNGLISFLKTQGDVKVVSSPKIMTLNNQPAIINVGKTVNFRFDNGSNSLVVDNNLQTTQSFTQDSRFVGITLDITPEITENNDIILKINPIITSITDEHLDENGQRYLAPDMEIKQISTIVKVKNGEDILIGGLITNTKENTVNKVPILGDIPYLNTLFKNTKTKNNQKEVIIMIVPKIIEEEKKKDFILEIKNEELVDSDFDGVFDLKDKCPETPFGYNVNEFGCAKKINLKINFKENSYKIDDKINLEKINEISNILKDNKNLKITVIGHSSCTDVSSFKYNNVLSLKRANEVSKYLELSGISRDRIKSIGKGCLNPIVDNNNSVNRYKNQRVEVLFNKGN